MFNLNKEVKRLYQLRHDKIYGLPYKPKQYDKKIQHIDGAISEIDAEREGGAIPQSFHNHSLGFGRRLKKSKGQYHRPGGGFARHTMKGKQS